MERSSSGKQEVEGVANSSSDAHSIASIKSFDRLSLSRLIGSQGRANEERIKAQPVELSKSCIGSLNDENSRMAARLDGAIVTGKRQTHVLTNIPTVSS